MNEPKSSQRAEGLSASYSEDELSAEPLAHLAEPGLADLEAAAALVAQGLATRVVLVNFRSFPGLLWQAYELAARTGTQILPTATRPGGRVDLEVSKGEDHV